MAKSSKIIFPTLPKHYCGYGDFLSTTEAKMYHSISFNLSCNFDFWQKIVFDIHADTTQGRMKPFQEPFFSEIG